MSESNSWSSTDGNDPATLLDLYQISDEDLAHIRTAGEVISVDEMLARWYKWLETQPAYKEFFSDAETLRRAQALQVEYWRQLLSGQVDADYIESRLRLGETHARIGLPLNTYFAGATRFVGAIGQLLADDGMPEGARIASEQAISKLVNLDIAIVVETFTRLEKETIAAQNRSLMEMSTPVTEIWSGILLLPLVGIIDSQRAQDVMTAMLSKIAETHARIFVLDISGVGVVDTAVANHLVKITKATRLMGCESTISGVSPAIAQTIVELGIDVGRMKTTATMRDALADAFRNLDIQLTEIRK